MSNLDNLTQKILEEAKFKADKMIQDAKEKSDGIMSSKVKEAQDLKTKTIERAETEAVLMKERVISNAELRVRDEKLKVKQEVIDRVFKESKDALFNIDDALYIKFLQSNIKDLSLKGDEILVVPDNRKEKVKALKLPIKVSETENLETGFMIKDEKTTLDFSFDSLVDFLREELETEIARDLFQGSE